MTRLEILDLIELHYAHEFTERLFVPGKTPIPASGKVFDADDIRTLVDASLDFWLTTGRYTEQFEQDLANRINAPYAIFCNSGSSANLLAISALTSSKFPGRLQPGDEVITAAAGFPTTVNAIIQNRLTPVFVDIEIGSYNVDLEQIEAAIGPRTCAILLAHTLGNPFDIAISRLTQKLGIWFVEDICDALGSTYEGRHVGTFGHLATCSFYPAHHITTGEGGAVVCSGAHAHKLNSIVRSFRDWGRDCFCETGQDNACNQRFTRHLGDLPYGYDHKYTYSHIGYNLKATDMQAAIGVAQLRKLHLFTKQRHHNFKRLYKGLQDLDEHLILPWSLPKTDPSWFGFPVTTVDGRLPLVTWLEEHKIATRPLFGGNLLKQPAYRDVPHRSIGTLPNTDRAMTNTFWIGVYPGITDPMIDYMIEVFHDYFTRAKR